MPGQNTPSATPPPTQTLAATTESHGTTATYVEANPYEIAAALTALIQEPHPLLANEPHPIIL